MTKKCFICGKEFKPRNSRILCCSKECSKQYIKTTYKRHREEILQRVKDYQSKYRDRVLNTRKKYSEKKRVYYTKICPICKKEFKTTRSTIICCSKECGKIRERNKTQEYLNKKYKDNTNFKLSVLLRSNLRRCLTFVNNYNKEYKTFDILNYTPQQLKQRLEFQFKNGMNWDNYGTYWVVHHKKELHKFNFGDKDNINYEQIRIANSLANLQPITIEEHKLIHFCS